MEYFNDYHLKLADSLFSKRVRERAEEYYEKGAIDFQKFDKNGLHFLAWGTEPLPYKVCLSVDDRGTIARSGCSCPYPDYCKHIYAALLEAVYSALPVRKGEGSSQFSYESPHLHSMIQQALDPSIPPRTDTKKKYLLFFFVEVESYFGYRNKITIRPCMHYLKLDGELGAVYEYRDSATLVETNKDQDILLEICLKYENRRAEVHGLLNFIHDNAELPLYTGNLRTPKPLRVLRPDSITMEFKPGFNGDDVGFTPLLILNPEDAANEIRVPPAEFMVWLRGIPGMLFSPKNGVLVELPLRDTLEIRLLRLLVELRHLYSIREMEAIRESLAGKCIHVRDLPTDLEIRSTESSPVLFIEEISEETHLRLQAMDGDNKAGVFRKASGGWEIRIRDTEAEIRNAERLFTRLSAVIYSVNEAVLSKPLIFFLENWAYTLLDEGWDIRVGVNGKKLKKPQLFHIEIVSGVDWLGLRAMVEDKEIDLRDVDHGLHLLEFGTEYTLLDKAQIEKLLRMAKAPLDAKGRVRIHEDDIRTIDDLGPVLEGLEDPRILRIQSIIAKLEESPAPENLGISPLLQGELRDYQKEGLDWLRFLKTFTLGGILADDMGLGKTIQTIALMADWMKEDEEGPFLVVAPLSTIPNWISEMQRFLPAIQTQAHIGANRTSISGKAPGVTITSYQILQRDIEDIASVSWKLVCLDESQHIKNHRTRSHAAVRRLKADQTLALSGTPIENNVMELWSVMDILNPGLLGPRAHFKKRYLKPIDKGKEEVVQELKRRISPFILRRTKDAVAEELPPREEIVHKVSLSPGEERFYTRLKIGLRDQVKAIIARGFEDISVANAVLLALLKLRQAAISPALIGETPKTSSKLNEAMILLKTAIGEGHKVLIFSQFVKVLGMMREQLDEENIAYAYLDGSLGSRDRESAIASFRNEHDVFLISIKAGGTGLNLTEADYVFILDPWWNPAVEAQAIDRSHRIGQNRPVIAYRFIAADTVEERILELQEKKRRLVDDLIGGEPKGMRKLNPEEILRLFS